MKELLNKKILVVGLGKTGESVCRFLHQRGLSFDVADSRSEPSCLPELLKLTPQLKINTEFSEALFCQFDVLIVSPGVPLSTPAIATAAKKGSEIIGDIELFARVVDAPVIAVTGSNGKSTVVAWLEKVLEQTSLNAVLCGNIGEPVLNAIRDDVDIYIVEVSSFQLETTSSLAPLSATVLNVSEDHLDRYEDIEHYATTKRRIYHGAQFGVVNSKDARTKAEDPHKPTMNDEVGNAAPAIKILEFGDKPSHDNYFGIDTVNGVDWLATPETVIIEISSLPLPGAHNVANALAVLALLHPLNLDASQLRQGLLSFNGLPHRTQLVIKKNNIRWYNDSKGTNVDACRRAIEAMECPVVLIAGGLGKNADFTELRLPVQQHVKALILIGQDAGLIENALGDLIDVVRAATIGDAVEHAAKCAKPGDAVLLSPACASFDMFDSFEHRGDVFTQEVMRVAA